LHHHVHGRQHASRALQSDEWNRFEAVQLQCCRDILAVGGFVLLQGTMPGARRQGRPRTAWIYNIKTWTGLPVEESVRMTEKDRDKWRKYVHGVANPRTAKENRTVLLLLERPAYYAQRGPSNGPSSARSSVCLSVCLSHRPLLPGLLLWARRPVDDDRFMHGARQQMRAVTRCQPP